MVSTCSSSSSCTSFSSFDDVTVKSTTGTIKFLCSYGGKILPRYPDGKLRYIGGDSRVLAVDRFVPFSELQAKLKELCGWETVSIRCQLPTEDLDALVSVTSDEDVRNLVEEYDLASRDRYLPLKIRAFLLPPLPPSKAPKYFCPPSTPPISASAKGKSVIYHVHASRTPPPPSDLRCVQQVSGSTRRFPNQIEKPGSVCHHHYHHHNHHHRQAYGNTNAHNLLVHHGNHRQ